MAATGISHLKIMENVRGRTVLCTGTLYQHYAGGDRKVTQATLSRDIKQLKVAKVHDGTGDYVYRLPEESISKQAQPEGKKKPNIEFSGNLAVVKTRPGYAMGIASDIDSQAPSEILATIAGDDTILVIPRNGVSQEKVIAALSHFI